MTRAFALVDRHPRIVVGLAMLATSLAVYVPFLGSMDKVCRYWDGPPYLYVAKTLYQVPEDHPFVPYDLPRAYFANHLPAYPLLVRALSLVTLGSYPVAMLLATLVSSIAAAVLFYELLARSELVASPLWTALLFCVLPPRWVIYHAVGATEPLFFCCVFAAFLALRAERPGLVVLLSLVASLTRITGALLPGVFFLIYVQRREWRRALLMPAAGLGLLALFTWYRVVYGDFWAYFTWSMGPAGMISLHPFEIFRRYASSEKLHSVELYAWMYVVYGLGVLALWKRRELFTYAFVYFSFCTLVTHQDLPRYLLAIAPFALLVGFDEILARPACRWVLPLVLYVDYTYAWRFLPQKLVSSGVYERLLEVLAR